VAVVLAVQDERGDARALVWGVVDELGHQYDFGRPSECMPTKFRIISRLTGAMRPARAATSSPATPYSWVMPLPPCACTARSAASQAASAAAYFAMFAASPAAASSPAS